MSLLDILCAGFSWSEWGVRSCSVCSSFFVPPCGIVVGLLRAYSKQSSPVVVPISCVIEKAILCRVFESLGSTYTFHTFVMLEIIGLDYEKVIVYLPCFRYTLPYRRTSALSALRAEEAPQHTAVAAGRFRLLPLMSITADPSCASCGYETRTTRVVPTYPTYLFRAESRATACSTRRAPGSCFLAEAELDVVDFGGRCGSRT
jgi:hypothetical protein